MEDLQAQIRALEERIVEWETRYDQQKAASDYLLEKHLPISQEKLDKKFAAIQETMNDYANMTVQFQLMIQAQNDKIVTIDSQAQNLLQQVVMLSVMSQTGMPVPKE